MARSTLAQRHRLIGEEGRSDPELPRSTTPSTGGDPRRSSWISPASPSGDADGVRTVAAHSSRSPRLEYVAPTNRAPRGPFRGTSADRGATAVGNPARPAAPEVGVQEQSCDTIDADRRDRDPGSTPGGSTRPDTLADQTASVGSIEITASERSSAWRQFRSGRTGRSTRQTPPATRRSFSSTASGCCRAAGTAGSSSSARLATRRSLRTGRTILRPSRRPARTRTSLPRRR